MKINWKEGITVKLRIILFLLFVYGGAAAQEPLMPELPAQDTVSVEAERQLMYHQFLSGTLQSGEMMEPLQLPEFDFRGELSRRYNFSFSESMEYHQWNLNGMLPGTHGFTPSPFLRDGAVLSSAAYKLGNGFTLGGYSFGANSIHTAPFPNQGINNFDVRGSTLFMKYNVSKNFKIETRVNVTQGPGY